MKKITIISFFLLLFVGGTLLGFSVVSQSLKGKVYVYTDKKDCTSEEISIHGDSYHKYEIKRTVNSVFKYKDDTLSNTIILKR
jgi:hypothetical protein